MDDSARSAHVFCGFRIFDRSFEPKIKKPRGQDKPAHKNPEADTATVIQSTVKNTHDWSTMKEQSLAVVNDIYETGDPLVIEVVDASIALFKDVTKRRSQG